MITRLYDEILAPSGISAAQFDLLATLVEIAPATIHYIADAMAIDRTTLTRNLALLTKKHLVRCEEGKDRRVRLVFLTQEGMQVFNDAWPLWNQAQTRVEQALGRERMDSLIVELATVTELIR